MRSRPYVTLPPEEAVICRPLEIVCRPDESPERFARRFTKKIKADGVIQEFLQRRSFEKRSERLRRRRADAARVRRLDEI